MNGTDRSAYEPLTGMPYSQLRVKEDRGTLKKESYKMVTTGSD